MTILHPRYFRDSSTFYFFSLFWALLLKLFVFRNFRISFYRNLQWTWKSMILILKVFVSFLCEVKAFCKVKIFVISFNWGLVIAFLILEWPLYGSCTFFRFMVDSLMGKCDYWMWMLCVFWNMDSVSSRTLLKDVVHLRC